MSAIFFLARGALTVILIAVLSSSSLGSIIASWDLTGDPGNQATEPAAFSAAGVVGNAITRGAGLGALGAADSFNSNNWDDEVDEYLEFGFTVLPGMTVDLDNLIIATRSSATGPGTIGLFSSLDGFTTALSTIVQPSGTFVNSILDLSALPTLGAGAFAVRLIEVGDTAADNSGPTQGVGTFRIAEHLAGGTFTDVQFNGTLAVVPELSAFAVWGLLFSCGMLKRRR